ncbi:hypothetical protein H074_36144 [Amycolatopsis decaplanina DSM 44594]|uniref:Uncharacterized protein n=1 Tax=Amycolatopsis decaplanina DSM 44594 TaxID=1284240 RepID=M2XRF9_9PSEU|nr:hypothetical protein H074_36144 [Amycolatopsis decaplanina DSM 44594]
MACHLFFNLLRENLLDTIDKLVRSREVLFNQHGGSPRQQIRQAAESRAVAASARAHVVASLAWPGPAEGSTALEAFATE